MTRFAIQVKGTGAAPTSWTVELQVSLDGTNFMTLFSHKSTTGSNNELAAADGDVVFSYGGTFYPALYFRSKCTAVSLGSATNIVATIVGMY